MGKKVARRRRYSTRSDRGSQPYRACAAPRIRWRGRGGGARGRRDDDAAARIHPRRPPQLGPPARLCRSPPRAPPGCPPRLHRRASRAPPGPGWQRRPPPREEQKIGDGRVSGPMLTPLPSAKRPRARRAAPAWRWREPPPRAPGGHGGRRAGATQVRAGSNSGGRGRGGAPEWSEAGGPPHRRSRQAATTMMAAMTSAHEVAQPRRPQRAAWPRWAAAARGGRKQRLAKVAPPPRPAVSTRAGRRRALLCSALLPPSPLSL